VGQQHLAQLQMTGPATGGLHVIDLWYLIISLVFVLSTLVLAALLLPAPLIHFADVPVLVRWIALTIALLIMIVRAVLCPIVLPGLAPRSSV
jgi:hypothetical protein